MLTSYLRGGDTVDFTIRRDTRQVPIIQMQMTADDGARMIGAISLTPTEAITMAEHLNELVNSVADYCGGGNLRYTQPPQEEEPLRDLHPRAEQLLANADLNPATGEHINETEMERTEDRERSRGEPPLPADTPSSSLFGHVQKKDADAGRTDGPRRERSETGGLVQTGQHGDALHDGERGNPLVRGENTDPARSMEAVGEALERRGSDAIQGKGMVMNVEIDDALAGHVSEIRSSESQHESSDEADQWQFDLDQFVNDLRLRPSKAPNDKKNIYFEMLSPPVSDADDEIRMPFAVTAHPLIRSQAMRKLITEVFQQAFRYGASWENAR